MSTAEELFALGSALMVVLCGLLSGQIDDEPVPSAGALEPVVGRRDDEVAAGPPPAFAHVRRTTAAERESERRAGVFRELDALATARTWTEARFDAVIVYPLAGSLPEADLEEGPPWHLVLLPGGKVRSTERFRRGRQGTPPGLPAARVRRAVHLMIPDARRMDANRRRMLDDVLAWIEVRIGPDGRPPILASDVPGSTVVLPEGVSRGDLLR